MRKFSFDELAKKAPSSLELAERFPRQAKIRRKPRSAAESLLLGEMIQNRVREARERGKLVRDGKRLIIRL
ncbi:hypothetical protein [Alicyclobacillus fodiniaquatilis]|uniref:Uncharacterized protein n=1 Tax=Alicyclobacillus fodiniaquatilis TaxID=1661150 RepID=A0ABW4JNY0_9BACL